MPTPPSVRFCTKPQRTFSEKPFTLDQGKKTNKKGLISWRRAVPFYFPSIPSLAVGNQESRMQDRVDYW
jgi:hypothetical protein